MATKSDPKKTPPKKKKAHSSAPSFQFGLMYDTAASLHHLISAQIVHAQHAADEGFPVLLECTKTVERFYLALGHYLDQYS